MLLLAGGGTGPVKETAKRGRKGGADRRPGERQRRSGSGRGAAVLGRVLADGRRSGACLGGEVARMRHGDRIGEQNNRLLVHFWCR